jgi:hypothetical protein
MELDSGTTEVELALVLEVVVLVLHQVVILAVQVEQTLLLDLL